MLVVLVSSQAFGDNYFRSSGFDVNTRISEISFYKDNQLVGKIHMTGIKIIDQQGNIPDGLYKYSISSQLSDKTIEGETLIGQCTIKNGKVNGLYKTDILLDHSILEANYKDNVLHGLAQYYATSDKNKVKWKKYYNNGELIKEEKK